MKKLLFIIALLVVVSYSDTTTTSVTADLHIHQEDTVHIEEPQKPKEKENKLLSAVIMMLFIGISMGVVGNMNPR